MTSQIPGPSAAQPPHRDGRHLLPVANIHVGERFRAVYPDRVAEIAASMAAFGQMQPIIVGPLLRSGKYRGKHRLAAGLHRLRAAEQLGWAEVWVDVEQQDGDHLRMLELVENLHRAELSPLDRATFTAEYKRIYESLFPAVGHGQNLHNARKSLISSRVGHDVTHGDGEVPDTTADGCEDRDMDAGASTQDGAPDAPTSPPEDAAADTDGQPGDGPDMSNVRALFPSPTGDRPPRATAALAEQLRLSERSVKRDLRLGQGIAPAVRKLLSGTEVAHQRPALAKLAKLADPELQLRAARALLDGADAHTAIARAQGLPEREIRAAAERRAARRAPAQPDALDIAEMFLALNPSARLTCLIEITRRDGHLGLAAPVHIEIDIPTNPQD